MLDTRLDIGKLLRQINVNTMVKEVLLTGTQLLHICKYWWCIVGSRHGSTLLLLM